MGKGGKDASKASGGESRNIEIFLRLKPVQRPAKAMTTDAMENIVTFNVPKDDSAGYVNNQREHYEFKFNGILGPEVGLKNARFACRVADVLSGLAVHAPVFGPCPVSDA